MPNKQQRIEALEQQQASIQEELYENDLELTRYKRERSELLSKVERVSRELNEQKAIPIYPTKAAARIAWQAFREAEHEFHIEFNALITPVQIEDYGTTDVTEAWANCSL